MQLNVLEQMDTVLVVQIKHTAHVSQISMYFKDPIQFVLSRTKIL